MNAARRHLLFFFLLLVPALGFGVDQTASTAQVALLDMDTSGKSGAQHLELVALKRIFATLGIPADVVSGPERLSDYRVVCTAGALLNTTLAREISNGLFDYVEAGGILVSAGEIGSSMYPLFGLTGQVPGRKRYRLGFVSSDVSTSFIDYPNERTISLGNGERHFFDEVIWSHGAALSPDAAALGLFDDGTVGFSLHSYGRGKAYLLGLSYAESVLLPQVGGSYNAERQYANGFEPSADVILLILKSICMAASSPAVCLATIPYARPVGLVLTHDVDAQSSFLDSLKFAELEKRYGVTSTFFVTTKYFTDASDIDYFNVPENLNAVRELRRRGWDIGSHTVSHSVELASAPEGDPGVTRQTYEPASHLTVWGETRVSKELLDRELPGQTTLAYRSGDLAFPRSLIRVLQGCGYAYDSTYSANAVLSAFPYFAFEEQDMGSRESPLVEIPVTLDDSQGYLTPDNGAAVVKGWLEVMGESARYGGLTVLLMHPSDTRTKTYKLRAQESLMRAVSAQGGWMGNLSAVGRFWLSRAALHFSAQSDRQGALVIRLDAKASEVDPGVGFEMSGAVKSVVVLDSTGKPLDYTIVSRDGKLYAGRQP
ncbi:MAG: polysaccharide deacetylase family protein [Spirochaetia bacterium]|jgi:peptidoglycan/xylan/chitin deacetylase (PgdA/CDA1 family)